MRVSHLIAGPEKASSGDFAYAQEEIDLLRAAGDRLGLSILAEAWDDPHAATDADLIIVGPVWDYQDRASDFLNRMEALNNVAPVLNPPDLIRWNLRKTYLRELEQAGARIPPTLWSDKSGPSVLTRAFDHFDTETIVVKHQIGAGAVGLVKLDRADLDDPGAPRPLPGPILIQPFLDSLPSEGELSFIFFDGSLAHALLKKPKPGDFRSQGEYGATETRLTPSDADRAAAEQALAAVPGDHAPLYARVDLARLEDGALAVMEIELIEPQLYFNVAPDSADAFAAAIARRRG